MERADYFSPDYGTARDRFHSAASAAGAKLYALPLAAKGPAGEALTIDIAWLGSTRPRRTLIQTSGLHGIEAFAGSAIQLCLLDRLPDLGTDNALILVHVLNPYGMAWLRRTNENNVDLNRNFLKRSEAWSGAPDLYLRLDPFLNPPSPPGFDWFYLRGAWLVMRYGLQPLQQVIAQGQYERPRGLFYGGSQCEQGPRLYVSWLRQYLENTPYLFALDVHTGLGAWGEEMLILDTLAGGTHPTQLSAALKRRLMDPTHDGANPYTIRGGMSGMFSSTLPRTRVDFLLQELGTYGPMRVLRALREENRWHHFGAGSADHPVKKALLEALCPFSAGWRRRAVEQGVSLAHAIAGWVFLEHDG